MKEVRYGFWHGLEWGLGFGLGVIPGGLLIITLGFRLLAHVLGNDLVTWFGQ